MSSVAEILPAATPMRKRFAMWELDEFGRESQRFDLEAATLHEAIAEATPAPFPAKYVTPGGKPNFVILETDDTAREGRARHVLHVYMVKLGRGYRRLGDYGEVVRTAEPKAVHIGSLSMNAFDPRRPFSAQLDCPGTGRQPGEAHTITVEARR